MADKTRCYSEFLLYRKLNDQKIKMRLVFLKFIVF